MILLADRTPENVEAPVYSSRYEERKTSKRTTQNTRVLPDSVSLNIWKNGCVYGTTLRDQILCMLKENAE